MSRRKRTGIQHYGGMPSGVPCYHYNLSYSPASFDFLVWLAAVTTHNDGNEFDLVITSASHSRIFRQVQEDVYGDDAMRQMLHNVMIPAIELFPVRSCNIFPPDLMPGAIPKSPFTTMGYTAHIFRVIDKPVKSLVVPDWAKRWVYNRYGDGFVVMNYRQCGYHPSRNSNMDAWIEASKQMMHRVIHCPDVNQVFNFYGEVHSDRCLAIKAALFEAADVVLGVNCGTMSLAWHNENVRYVTYKPIVDGISSCSWQDYKDRGFKEGGSWPWAKPWQLYQWGDDTTENILEGFSRIQKFIGTGQPASAQ